MSDPAALLPPGATLTIDSGSVIYRCQDGSRVFSAPSVIHADDTTFLAFSQLLLTNAMCERLSDVAGSIAALAAAVSAARAPADTGALMEQAMDRAAVMLRKYGMPIPTPG